MYTSKSGSLGGRNFSTDCVLFIQTLTGKYRVYDFKYDRTIEK